MDKNFDIRASLEISLKTQDISSYKRSLQECKRIEEVCDIEGSNILHSLSSCLLSESESIRYLITTIEAIREKEENELLSIKALLDSQTANEHLTPVHLAIIHSKVGLFKEYLKFNPNLEIRDINERTVVHLAAFHGKDRILSHLAVRYRVEIEVKDRDDRTPLHLAVIAGNEHASDLLISQTEDFTIFDNDGFSVLHMAAMHSHYRIAKHLILNGAKRSLRDRDGNTPYAIATLNNLKEMTRLLEKEPGCLSKFNPFVPPVTKERYKRIYMFHHFVYWIRYLLLYLFIFPRFYFYSWITSISICLLCYTIFLFVSCKNPGFTNKKENLSVIFRQDLHDKFFPEFICVYCSQSKNKSTKHCYVCNRCVLQFDHHCPWMNNCVGKGNHKLFILYLCVCLVDYLYHLTICLIALILDLEIIRYLPFSVPKIVFPIFLSVVCFVGFVFVLYLLYLQITNRLMNTTTKKRLKHLNSSSHNTTNSSMLLSGWSLTSLRAPSRR